MITEKMWQEAVERAKNDAPPVPDFSTSKEDFRAGKISFRGWIAMIGGYDAQHLTEPLDGTNLEDVQYIGLLRRIVAHPSSGEKKMFVAVIPGESAFETQPGSTFKVGEGIKRGQFTPEEIDYLVSVAKHQLTVACDAYTTSSPGNPPGTTDERPSPM